MAKSNAHRFGQLIGDFLELAILPNLQEFAKVHNLYLDRKGFRKARKKRIKVTWEDIKGSSHDLDFVLEKGGTEEKIGIPVAFIESAWRRGTRHSKAKVQEIQAAVNPIALKYYSSVCFKGAIMAGDYTKPAMRQLHLDHFTVLRFSTSQVVDAFNKFGLEVFSSDKTSEEEYARRIELLEAFPFKVELAKELFESNKNAVDEFIAALKKAVTRSINKIIVYPVHSQGYTLSTIDEAVSFLKEYSDSQTDLPLWKFHIFIEYNNGDKIEASFDERVNAIKFLQTHT